MEFAIENALIMHKRSTRNAKAGELMGDIQGNPLCQRSPLRPPAFSQSSASHGIALLQAQVQLFPCMLKHMLAMRRQTSPAWGITPR